jgi:hypothetical protein
MAYQLFGNAIRSMQRPDSTIGTVLVATVESLDSITIDRY